MVISSAAAPLNDDFANRLMLEGEDVLIQSSLAGSTLEKDAAGLSEVTGGLQALDCEPYQCESSLGSVWWAWRAPRTGAAFLLPNEPRDPDLYCTPTVSIWDSGQVSPGSPLHGFPLLPLAELNSGYSRPRYPYSVFWAEVGRIYYVQMAGPVASRYSARLRMLDPPFIVEEPPDRTLRPGEYSFLSVLACGVWTNQNPRASQLTYEWRHNGVILPASNYPLLLLSNVTGQVSGDYQVIVRDREGAVTSRVARVTVAAEDMTSRLAISRNDELSTIRATLSGAPGRIYRLESSTNLIDWTFQPVQGLSASALESNIVGVYPPPPYSHVLLRSSTFEFLISGEQNAFFLRAQLADPRCNPCAVRLWMTQFATEAMLRENPDFGGLDDVTGMDIDHYLPRSVSGLGNPAQDPSCWGVLYGNGLRQPSWGCPPADGEPLRYDDLVNPRGVWNGK